MIKTIKYIFYYNVVLFCYNNMLDSGSINNETMIETITLISNSNKYNNNEVNEVNEANDNIIITVDEANEVNDNIIILVDEVNDNISFIKLFTIILVIYSFLYAYIKKINKEKEIERQRIRLEELERQRSEAERRAEAEERQRIRLEELERQRSEAERRAEEEEERQRIRLEEVEKLRVEEELIKRLAELEKLRVEEEKVEKLRVEEELIKRLEYQEIKKKQEDEFYILINRLENTTELRSFINKLKTDSFANESLIDKQYELRDNWLTEYKKINNFQIKDKKDNYTFFHYEKKKRDCGTYLYYDIKWRPIYYDKAIGFHYEYIDIRSGGIRFFDTQFFSFYMIYKGIYSYISFFNSLEFFSKVYYDEEKNIVYDENFITTKNFYIILDICTIPLNEIDENIDDSEKKKVYFQEKLEKKFKKIKQKVDYCKNEEIKKKNKKCIEINNLKKQTNLRKAFNYYHYNEKGKDFYIDEDYRDVYKDKLGFYYKYIDKNDQIQNCDTRFYTFYNSYSEKVRFYYDAQNRTVYDENINQIITVKYDILKHKYEVDFRFTKKTD
jgi:hypothetical protein